MYICVRVNICMNKYVYIYIRQARIQCLPPMFLFFLIFAMAKSDFSCVETRVFSASPNCASFFRTQVPKLCTDLDVSLLHILISGTYSEFARKNNFLALGVCFPQPCSSAGRRFAASRSLLQNRRRIVSFPQQKIR